ncbi:hypothetical protein ABE137_12105 [Brevibacillus laterosporus]|uniref:hypothetical protein n=1 Tax=Brevibacillus phage Sundance TaxID=1691958 RepID=UPI0006BD3F03|nr:hypothetical protein AVT09_gp090 [Brevibacillus phage Sundance]ALA47906.1 hypothetical protein SUNDANCE_90 [Brevibacillus phage Sundance]
MKPLSKKELVDLLAYITILVHNRDTEGISIEQLEKALSCIREAFKDDEKKAIAFVKGRVLKLLERIN